jgi:hypothetical protein
MKNWYKISQVGGTQDDSSYSADVQVVVYGGNDKYDIEVPQKKLSIPFRIELDIRSWGIKGVDIFVDGTISVSIFLNDPDTMMLVEEKDIVVDLAKIQKEELDGRGMVTLKGLDLYLDQNLNVDYKSSSLEIYR